jgi:hypothetical protein
MSPPSLPRAGAMTVLNENDQLLGQLHEEIALMEGLLAPLLENVPTGVGGDNTKLREPSNLVERLHVHSQALLMAIQRVQGLRQRVML